MSAGIMGVMEVDVVAKNLTAHWMVGNLDMTKCVATAVTRNSESCRRSGGTVCGMSASPGLKKPI
jgi:hypothetical protein